MSEPDRRRANKDRALELLVSLGEVTNLQLVRAAGIRYGARIFELRKQGHRIKTLFTKGAEGRVVYRYDGPPARGEAIRIKTKSAPGHPADELPLARSGVAVATRLPETD